MMTIDATVTEILDAVREPFERHRATHDRDGHFVADNYALLKEHRVMSLMVPAELGGLGVSHAGACELLRGIGRACPSTALALSMHQHLVAAAVWKYRHQGASDKLLRKVANEQTVLLSTGATDWIDSNGTMTKVEGGYRVTARKVFGSGGPGADLIIASAQYDDPEKGPSVLHFPVPMGAEGVRPLRDWDTVGMRGTGSHTILFENVFVPDEAIALQRPQGQWHPAWSVVLTVALPLIMSVYVGVAEEARDKVVGDLRGRTDDPHRPYLVGEMDVALHTAQLAWRGMVRGAANLDFAPDLARANDALIAKTLCASAAIATVHKAMEASGGRGFFRGYGLEQLLRDVQAAPYHPLPEKKQMLFSGRLALGLDPIGGAAA